ncbi:hypothetical protein GCM10023172_23600 [Hymenobacter ginsengisoli]|uniref:Histone n=1 Tax=Hymenobacter ginsengisoli TaxID=1051626 RepID=A0ABP8QE07_9BACT|nr:MULTISPECIES: hypothetical protein [unclassified Hymenobacter]MBO2033246.1 hypothetical protein [Hymenobacter sp. BT559]
MAINLNELQELLDKAEATVASDKEIRRSLARIENLMATAGEEVTKVYAILDGATPARKERKARAPREASPADAEAPYGRKADGTPKKRPGRAKGGEAAG